MNFKPFNPTPAEGQKIAEGAYETYREGREETAWDALPVETKQRWASMVEAQARVGPSPVGHPIDHAVNRAIASYQEWQAAQASIEAEPEAGPQSPTGETQVEPFGGIITAETEIVTDAPPKSDGAPDGVSGEGVAAAREGEANPGEGNFQPLQPEADAQGQAG
jgi:hypothetical protein